MTIYYETNQWWVIVNTHPYFALIDLDPLHVWYSAKEAIAVNDQFGKCRLTRSNQQYDQ